MKNGFYAIDSDLHVIEMGGVYEKYLDARYHDKMPRYLGWSPTNFPHWEVEGRDHPPMGARPRGGGPAAEPRCADRASLQPIRQRDYDAQSTLQAMDAEGIDVAVVYRTFAHMVVSIDGAAARVCHRLLRCLQRLAGRLLSCRSQAPASRRRSCRCTIQNWPPRRPDVPSSRRGM